VRVVPSVWARRTVAAVKASVAKFGEVKLGKGINMIRSEFQGTDVRKGRKRFRAGALISTLILGGVMGSGSLRPAPVAAQTATAEDPVLLRELVLRIAGDGSGGKSKLLVGALQTVTPAFSIPSGWRVIGAVVRESPTGVTGGPATEFSSNYVDAPTGTASEAISALTKTLTAGGWISQQNFAPNQGGFVVANSPQPAYAQFCSSTYYLSVNAYKDASGPVRVSLMANSTNAGFPVSCGTSAASPPATIAAPSIPPVYSQLPRLVLPDKAVLVNSGGGGGSQYSTSAGLTIDKADTPTVLESIFAPQMIEAGWQKVGGVASETASVSTWRKTFSGTPLQATLLIVNAIGGDQRRDLTITVSQEAKAGEYFGPPFPLAAPVMTVVPPVGGIAPPTTVAIASGAPTPIAKASSAASKTKTAVKKTSSAKSVKSVKKK
jgi:hypothetical protein